MKTVTNISATIPKGQVNSLAKLQRPKNSFQDKSLILKFWILALLLSCTQCVQAQNSYSFQTDNASYTELVGATNIPWNAFDPNYSTYMVNAPLTNETFHFYEIPFTFGGLKTFAIQPNGNIRIDNDSSLIVVDAAFTGMDSIDATSSISYLVSGTPGNYIVKTQWKNLKLSVGQANNFANLQIWVYQQTGVVEIHYGPRSANNASGFNVSYGPQIGMFYSRDDFTKCYEKLWITGSPTNIIQDTVANYTFNAMSGVPAEGTVYRFLPRFAPTHIQEKLGSTRNFSIYPNPSKGKLTLKINTPKKLEPVLLAITNALGNVVLKKDNLNIRNSAVELDISNLLDGMYFVTVKGADFNFREQFHLIKD